QVLSPHELAIRTEAGPSLMSLIPILVPTATRTRTGRAGKGHRDATAPVARQRRGVMPSLLRQRRERLPARSPVTRQQILLAVLPPKVGTHIAQNPMEHYGTNPPRSRVDLSVARHAGLQLTLGVFQQAADDHHFLLFLCVHAGTDVLHFGRERLKRKRPHPQAYLLIES